MERMSFADGQALVALYRDSGLKPGQFCREQAIPIHRLNYWRRRIVEVDTSQQSDAAGFVEVSAALAPFDEQRRMVSSEDRFVITAPSGWRIEGQGSLPSILQAMCSVC